MASILRRSFHHAKTGRYRRAIDTLDKATRRFAELMMDTTLASAMTGQTMQSADDTLGEGPTAPHPFAPAQYTPEPSKKITLIA